MKKRDAVHSLSRILRPLLDHSIKRMTPHDRAKMRQSVVNAGRHLHDLQLSPCDRLTRVQEELNDWQIVRSQLLNLRQSQTDDAEAIEQATVLVSITMDALGVRTTDEKFGKSA